MLTVIETPLFQQYAKDVWNDAEREAFVDYIAFNPLAGDVIRDTGGLRKVRWSRPGMGKRGGARVVYYAEFEDGRVVLLIVYVKAKLDNLDAETLRRLKEAYDG